MTTDRCNYYKDDGDNFIFTLIDNNNTCAGQGLAEILVKQKVLIDSESFFVFRIGMSGVQQGIARMEQGPLQDCYVFAAP